MTFYADKGLINAICGFGKEPATGYATSFVSVAKYKGYIDTMVFSLSIAPHLAATSAANSH